MKYLYLKLLCMISALIAISNPVLAAPDNPVAVSPLGQASSSSPEFVWQFQPGVSKYRLYIYDRLLQQRVHLKTYYRSQICDSEFCAVTPDIDLEFSKDHLWLVRARNSDGWGAWTKTSFDFVDSTPLIVSTISPNGSVASSAPEFLWTALENATKYRIYVRDVRSRTTLLLDDYNALDICSEGICSVTPSLTLPVSDYLFFRVRGFNTGGWGPYSTPRRFSFVPPNEPPIASDDSATVDAGETVSIPVLNNDIDTDGSLDVTSVTITRQPANGSLSLQSNGEVLYSPDSSNASSDSFEYTVNDDDGATSNEAIVNLTLVNQTEELLNNPDFSTQLTGWNTCDFTSVSVENNEAILTGRNCIDQSVEVTSNQQLKLSCEVRRTTQGDEWTGVGMSFYDENWNFISEPEAVPVTDTSYRNYTLTGTAPVGARIALAWVYTVSGAVVNRCSLSTTGGTEPPPPSGINFCPSYVDSTLYRPRANTLIIGPDDNWEDQIEAAPANTEILLRDGNYLLDSETILITSPDITIRSLSGNTEGVVIAGTGLYIGQSEGFMIAADHITIAELTMFGMRRHAIAMKPELDTDSTLYDTYVYNMNIYDTGTQHVKGSDGGDNRDAIIACNTIGYTLGAAVGDYNGAIGIFKGVNVVVRDNYIYNLTGDGTGCNAAEPEYPCLYESAPAIYMRSSTDSIIERNRIIESFRGISLGLHNGNVRGVVRNNYIYRIGPGDTGISIELSSGTIVEHNTVLVGEYWAPIEVKSGTGGHVFRNNLTNRPIQLRGTTGTILEGNIEDAAEDDFVSAGDPHLRGDSSAIGAGVAPTETISDIDGEIRSGAWDVGADQYSE